MRVLLINNAGAGFAVFIEVESGTTVLQFARWLRGQSVDRDVSLNLLASELSVC